MAKVYEFLADGFEEIEALAPVDILRRGKVDVVLVSIMQGLEVESAHGVTVKADVLFADCDFSDADLLLLPGGMPGASNLRAHEGLCHLLLEQNEKGKYIGAICASPAVVLATLGLMKGRTCTCYPGMEEPLKDANYTGALVEQDGNIITGAGPAASLPYGYKLLSLFQPERIVKAIEDGMIYTQLIG